ncbi:MAG TPA: glycosyltransferase [Candidatus Paceibacterota bacterium]|nr:glycosyltransferase [Candidatus Paceibacterota bacterium]
MLLAVVLVWGVNFIFWGVIGIIRILSDKILPFFHNNKKSHGNVINKIKRKDVAVMVPAHNEELVIDDTLISLKKIIAPENIFVISDGSNDRTVEIAKKYTNNVLDINPGKGKAGALETGIKHFHIQKNFKALVLVDADTRLKKNYLRKALPSFNDENVVAVAGYASTIWNPKKMSWRQTLFVSHRDRVYFLGQRLVKFGQTWKYTNVTPIVPGFASIYRTSILDKIDINPKGLVIEDFNMTFEVHHKKLGIIAHHPSVIAYTQDPDNADDYFRQIRRWHLGFWQTIKFHGFWPGKFWIAMIPTLIEVTLGSLVFLLTPILLLLSLILPQIFPSTQWPFFLETQYLLVALFVGIWLSDYLLTVIVAIIQRRKEYLVVGLFFPVVRILDSIAFLSGIPRAFFVKSNGRWISPSRRTQ